MKKLLCLTLALMLLLGLGAPAAAEGAETKDEQLRRVTLQVKTTLDIGDDYTSFNGDSYERGDATWWYLSWYKDEEGLNVTCDSAGKVYSMNRYFYDESYSYTSTLHFPGFGYAQALAAAKEFLPTVLGAGEDAVFQARQDSLQERSRYNLYGTLTLNGVETEIGLSLTFRTSDGLLLSFYRDDSEQLISGPVPSAVPAFGAKEALPKFSEAVTGRLEWAYTDYEKHEVRLAYQMGLDYGVMLDAQTGELFDRWNNFRGYSNASGGAMPEEAPAAADMEKGLTAVELAGAEKLEGVLNGEALLAAARAESAFGITEDYVLGSVNYRAAEAAVDPATLEEGQETDDSVTASFTLVKTLTGPGDGLTQEEYDELTESGYTPTIYKNFTADANTGEIRGLSTSYYGFGWKEREEAEEEPAVSDVALGFLEARYGDYLSLCELTRASQSRWSSPQNYFTYTRMEAGYPCPMNTISVTTNLKTGYVDSFSCNWDEEISFGPAGPLVGEEAARESFLDCYDAALRYVLVPQDPENWETAWSWRLVYLADIENGWVSGVDAVTGEANYTSWSEEELSLPYTDLEGSYAKKEIETLAGYGVRFYGVEEFLPKAEVTELDMLLLMLSARGMKLDYGEYSGYAEAGDEEALRWIYSEGYAQGFIASKEQAPFRAVTRTELCRCFVGLAGWGEAAELKGIYRTGFTDEESIPESDLGYVAIAKGLGVVQGDSDGAFRPEDTATRQELAVMLYRYLDR